jgi:hypothetical protein
MRLGILELGTLGLLLLGAAPSYAADPNQPHPHQGIAPRIQGTPQGATLTDADKAILQQGRPVEKTIQYDGGGRGVAIQWVQAPVSDIWAVILSFGKYPAWVDGVKSCTLYRQGNGHYYVDFVIGKFGITKQYYIDHVLNKSQGYLSWTLDYSRLSDFDDSTGYWLVKSIQEDPPLTQVEYSVDLRLAGVPDFLAKYLTRDALTTATSWVKKQAEARASAG